MWVWTTSTCKEDFMDYSIKKFIKTYINEYHKGTGKMGVAKKFNIEVGEVDRRVRMLAKVGGVILPNMT